MNSSFQCAPFAAVVVCFVAASTAQGQSGTQFKDWNPPSDEVRLKAKLACADLRSLTGFEFSVVTANTIAATADAREHCRVSGGNPHLSGAGRLFERAAACGGAKSGSLCGTSGERWPWLILPISMHLSLVCS